MITRVFDAVLFDLDGTLIDSGPAVAASWLAWADERGIAPDRLRDFHGVPARDIVATLIPTGDIESALARIHELELAQVSGIVALPGAARALAELPSDRVALVTSCTAALAASRLAIAGLPQPKFCVTADDVRAGKPDPEPFRLGAHRLGVDPTRCLAIEDAPHGLASARAAGATTIGVGQTVPRAELIADLVVGSVGDLQWRVTDAGISITA